MLVLKVQAGSSVLLQHMNTFRLLVNTAIDRVDAYDINYEARSSTPKTEWLIIQHSCFVIPGTKASNCYSAIEAAKM